MSKIKVWNGIIVEDFFNSKEQLKVYSEYLEDNTLETFTHIQFYPLHECDLEEDGCSGCRHFRLIGLNKRIHKYKNLGQHDSMDSVLNNIPVNWICVMGDGSFLIGFKKQIKIEYSCKTATILNFKHRRLK